MGWKQRISLVVLMILAALPLSGTICAMMCGSTAAPRHHASDATCASGAQASGAARITGLSGHDCSNHDASIRRVAASVAERSVVQVHPAPSADLAAPATFTPPAISGHTFAFTGPPRTAPPTTTALVLRL